MGAGAAGSLSVVGGGGGWFLVGVGGARGRGGERRVGALGCRFCCGLSGFDDAGVQDTRNVAGGVEFTGRECVVEDAPGTVTAVVCLSESGAERGEAAGVFGGDRREQCCGQRPVEDVVEPAIAQPVVCGVVRLAESFGAACVLECVADLGDGGFVAVVVGEDLFED